MINIFNNKELVTSTKIFNKYDNVLKLICYLLVAYCVLLRCYLYIYHKDMWADECALADAIYEAPWGDILAGRLPRVQSCPLLFAIIAKLFTYTTSYSPYVLYFLPTVAGILIIFLIYHFGVKLYGYLFTACCLNILSLLFTTIYYSSEFKPYILDFLFTVILFGTLFVDARKKEACSLFLSKKYPLLFALSWLCSSTAIICATAVGFTIFISLAASKKFTWTTLFLKLIEQYWLFVIFAGTYYFFYLKQGASDGMYSYWVIHKAFIPTNLSEFPQWCNIILRFVFYSLTYSIYGSNFSNALFFLAIIGSIYAFFNWKYELLAFLSFYIIISILAIKVYPLGLPMPTNVIASRLVLYTLPPIIFFASLGICSVINVCCKLQPRFQFFIIVFVFTVGLYGVAQSGIYYFKNRIHTVDTFQMYQMVSEQYNESSDLIVADNAVEYSFTYWKIFNSKLDKFPFIQLYIPQLATLKDDLFELIGKSNYENRDRIFFLFACGDQKVINNVIDYFEKHGFYLRHFKWFGAELLIIELKKH